MPRDGLQLNSHRQNPESDANTRLTEANAKAVFAAKRQSKLVWRPFRDSCQHCGGDAEVLTDTGVENLACDGDEARCSACKCPGGVVVTEDDCAYIDWHDEPNCKCDWCKDHPA